MDSALHNIVTSIAAKHIEELIKLKDFAELDVMSDFALSIIRTTIGAYKDEQKRSTLQLQFAESQLQRKTLYFEFAEALRSKLQNCLDLLNNTRNCRDVNCDADFACYFDPSSFTLRCSRCQCKQNRS
jgi:hypothetical protein